MTKGLKLLILISVVGVTLFLVLTSLFPFKSKLFALLYAKPLSEAAEGSLIPTVELSVEGYQDKVVNISADQTPLTLSWKASNVKTCIGRAWGLSDKDQTWVGEKAQDTGRFTTSKLTKNNPYVYTIDCASDVGDAAGDFVVLNVGAKPLSQPPYIASLEAFSGGEQSIDLSKPTKVSLNEPVKLKWTGLNLSTPYSICVATGSWPTQYKNVVGVEVSDQITLTEQKVYRYSLFCSSESGLAESVFTLMPK